MLIHLLFSNVLFGKKSMSFQGGKINILQISLLRLYYIPEWKEVVHNLCMMHDFNFFFCFRRKFHFICHRTDLLAISSTLYERFSDWSIYATKFRSVIYLNKVDTEEKQQRDTALTDDQRRQISWGYKFEQYITSGSYNIFLMYLPINFILSQL